MQNMGGTGAWPRRTLTLIVCASLALATLLLPLQGAAQQKAGQTKALRIGYVLELKWPVLRNGCQRGKILEVAAQMINERGGVTVQGQKYNIELVGEDGKSTLDGNTAAANKTSL